MRIQSKDLQYSSSFLFCWTWNCAQQTRVIEADGFELGLEDAGLVAAGHVQGTVRFVAGLLAGTAPNSCSRMTAVDRPQHLVSTRATTDLARRTFSTAAPTVSNSLLANTSSYASLLALLSGSIKHFVQLVLPVAERLYISGAYRAMQILTSYFCHPRSGVATVSMASACASVRPSVCICHTITFESLDVESSFLVCGYTSSGDMG